MSHAWKRTLSPHSLAVDHLSRANGSTEPPKHIWSTACSISVELRTDVTVGTELGGRRCLVCLGLGGGLCTYPLHAVSKQNSFLEFVSVAPLYRVILQSGVKLII